jgi:hypothetical protein
MAAIILVKEEQDKCAIRWWPVFGQCSPLGDGLCRFWKICHKNHNQGKQGLHTDLKMGWMDYWGEKAQQMSNSLSCTIIFSMVERKELHYKFLPYTLIQTAIGRGGCHTCIPGCLEGIFEVVIHVENEFIDRLYPMPNNCQIVVFRILLNVECPWKVFIRSIRRKPRGVAVSTVLVVFVPFCTLDNIMTKPTRRNKFALWST